MAASACASTPGRWFSSHVCVSDYEGPCLSELPISPGGPFWASVSPLVLSVCLSSSSLWDTLGPLGDEKEHWLLTEGVGICLGFSAHDAKYDLSCKMYLIEKTTQKSHVI